MVALSGLSISGIVQKCWHEQNRVIIVAVKRAWRFSNGDILKGIPPGSAVARYLGFTPLKPWERWSGSSKPQISGHLA